MKLVRMTTCVMACPGSLYLAKLFMPETGTPETAGALHAEHSKSPYANAIDAAATGTRDGLGLALNVAAMLIVFIAFVAMFDALLGGIKPMLLAFQVPDDVTAIPFTLEGLLGWTALVPSLAPNAIAAPPASNPPGVGPPGVSVTSIEVPYRLMLSPETLRRLGMSEWATTSVPG